MPPRARKPKKPIKNKKAQMEPLFPELKKGAKKVIKIRGKQTPQKLAVGRAHQIRRRLSELLARGFVERGQITSLEEEIKRILSLYAKKRLSEKEANRFLASTEWVIKYIEMLNREKRK
ncbi:MAG: hypothetical protein J7J87_00645 [Candidatus Diapherotrites archaeon]|nr:hypothetical protein [Candidatus Diapherotrites archaeon]